MKHKGYVLSNVELIHPSDRGSSVGSVVVDNGVITGVETASSIDAGDREVVDCKGKWLAPGLIDVHVHLREPGFEWKETVATGAQSAVEGGYTSICCMPNTTPAIDHAEVVAFINEQSEEAGLSRVFPIGAVTMERKGKQLAPLYELRKAGCLAFSDDGDPIWDAGVMRRALEISKDLDVPICCHEEDCSLSCAGSMDECGHSYALGIRGWPAVAEEVMIARDIELARATGGAVHICHVSTARGALLIERAKNDGIRITAEVTPHHLTLNHHDVDGVDTNYKMSPPLRSPEDVLALRKALADGVIDCIASDHAPHDSDSKEVEFESATMGIIGLQTNLALTMRLINSGDLPRERAFDALSSAAARIFKIDGGKIEKGAPADLVLIDPKKKWKFEYERNFSRSSNSPFFGEEFEGSIAETIIGGNRFSAMTDVQRIKEAV